MLHHHLSLLSTPAQRQSRMDCWVYPKCQLTPRISLILFAFLHISSTSGEFQQLLQRKSLPLPWCQVMALANTGTNFFSSVLQLKSSSQKKVKYLSYLASKALHMLCLEAIVLPTWRQPFQPLTFCVITLLGLLFHTLHHIMPFLGLLHTQVLLLLMPALGLQKMSLQT